MNLQAGKRLQYELGNYLRRRYDGMIGPDYSSDKIYIRSSDTDRTIMSALCNAAGMFPPSGEQVWEGSLNWQPVPIHTTPLNDDYLVYQSIPCARADKLHNEYMQSWEVEVMLGRHIGLMKYLEKHSGVPVRTVNDLHLFYESLNVEYSRGLP